MILVTGGLGFIGNEVVRQLLDSNHQVEVLDNELRVAVKIEDLNNVPRHKIDVNDRVAVADFIARLKPTHVVHLAAMHYIPDCNKDPEETLRVNVEGTLNIARVSAECGVERFIFASSGAVYADKAEALSENDLIDPVDIYGYSKKMSEDLLLWLSKTSKMKVTCCRLFNNYGPRETNAHIIPEVINQLKKASILKLGNIDPVRDYIHTSDTARIILRLLNCGQGPFVAVNVGTGQGVSVREIIQIMGRLLHRTITVETDPSRFRKVDKLSQIANVEYLRELINWTPDRSLENGIRDLLVFEGLLSASGSPL